MLRERSSHKIGYWRDICLLWRYVLNADTGITCLTWLLKVDLQNPLRITRFAKKFVDIELQFGAFEARLTILRPSWTTTHNRHVSFEEAKQKNLIPY
jgi:hypothetical protein